MESTCSPDGACVIREQALKQTLISPDSARQLLLHCSTTYIPVGVRSIRATNIHIFMDRHLLAIDCSRLKYLDIRVVSTDPHHQPFGPEDSDCRTRPLKPFFLP
jgi:hypothetical protein